MRTESGVQYVGTAWVGCLTMSSLVGSLIETGIGPGLTRGVGIGLTMQHGDLPHFTMGDGCL